MEQQAENTQQEPQQAPSTEKPEQVQDTVQQTTEQPQVTESVDLSKVDPAQLTPEQVTELQKGFMRDSDYTQKTQELATEKKGLSDYDALIQRPDFIQWAANKQAQTQQTQPQTQEQEDEKIASMSEQERVAYFVQKQMQPIAQSYWQDKQTMQDDKMTGKYGDVYKNYVPKIAQLQLEVAKNPNLYREEAFKILDYEAAQQRAREIGKQEGLKGIQQRTNANMVQETAPSTNQREVIRGPNALSKIFDRAVKEGRTA